VNQQTEERLAVLEQRINSSEQSSALVNRKGDAVSQFLSEVFEKMDLKVGSLEQGVALLNGE